MLCIKKRIFRTHEKAKIELENMTTKSDTENDDLQSNSKSVLVNVTKQRPRKFETVPPDFNDQAWSLTNNQNTNEITH